MLSVLTLFVLPVRMYWSQTLTAKYCYNRVRSLEEADHLLIEGKTGNVEIVELQNRTQRVKELFPSHRNDFVVSHS